MTSEKRGLSRPSSGQHAALPARVIPDLSPPADDDMWDDRTPMPGEAPIATYKKIAQTSSMLRRLVDESIPQLTTKVDSAVEASQSAQREAFDAKTAATLAQQRVEDVCKRVECLEPVKAAEAAMQVKVNGLNEKIQAGSDKRRWLNGIIVGLIVSLLGSAGTAIWWASQVDASVQHEATTRQHYDQAITEKLSDRPTRDEVLTRNELKTLRDELVRQREPTIEEWLGSLPPAKRAAVRRMIEESGGAVRDR